MAALFKAFDFAIDEYEHGKNVISGIEKQKAVDAALSLEVEKNHAKNLAHAPSDKSAVIERMRELIRNKPGGLS